MLESAMSCETPVDSSIVLPVTLSHNHTTNALIIEDDSDLSQHMTSLGITNTRLTHHEVMTKEHLAHFTKLHNKTYTLLWITMPTDWYARIPHKKHTSHWERLSEWCQTAHALQTPVFIFGPPGHPWTHFDDMFVKLKWDLHRIRFCSLGIKYNAISDKPSSSFFRLQTNLTIKHIWNCTCKCGPDQHERDWFGKENARAEWRRQSRIQAVHSVWTNIQDTIALITDHVTPLPLTTPAIRNTALPTEARLKQKEKLKADKAQGIEPKRRKTDIEFGNDDCGDDL